MQQLSSLGHLSAVIPLGMYEGMGQMESAGGGTPAPSHCEYHCFASYSVLEMGVLVSQVSYLLTFHVQPVLTASCTPRCSQRSCPCCRHTHTPHTAHTQTPPHTPIQNGLPCLQRRGTRLIKRGRETEGGAGAVLTGLRKTSPPRSAPYRGPTLSRTRTAKRAHRPLDRTARTTALPHLAALTRE